MQTNSTRWTRLSNQKFCCDTHDALIHQMFRTPLHMIHTLSRNIVIAVMFSNNSPLPKSKSRFWPSLIAACSPEAFISTLLVVSQLVKASIAGKRSTTSVSNLSNIFYTGIANFVFLLTATIQSSFNPE